jgi:hypothetical protein
MWTISPLSIDLSSQQDIQAKTIIPPRQTTFAYYKICKSEHMDTSCPEAWTSSALGALLNNVDSKSKSIPPPISLNLSKLSFVSHLIIFFLFSYVLIFYIREKMIYHLIQHHSRHLH